MSFSRLPLRAAAAIIFIFSFLLFLSGYILQQQSLAALSAALPQPTQSRTQKHLAQISRQHLAAGLTAQNPSIPGLIAAEDLQATALAAAHLKAHAYAAYITSPRQACHALQLFADLSSLPDVDPGTGRVLYYPASWNDGIGDGTWRRLLRSAEVRYSVRLTAVEDLDETHPAVALAAALREEENGLMRVLLIDIRGMVLQSLDSLLLSSAAGEAAVTGVRAAFDPTAISGDSLLLVRPDATQAERVEWAAGQDTKQGMTEVLNDLFGAHAGVLPRHPWVTPAGEFGKEKGHGTYVLGVWNPEKVRGESRYVSFVGAKAPWKVGSTHQMVSSSRGGRGEGIVRELYGRWEKRRAEICGLDLM